MPELEAQVANPGFIRPPPVYLLAVLIPAVALMQFIVIPREERYMEAKFGSEYVSYRASVRRWV